MLEIPESANIAYQLTQTLKDKVILTAVADSSPHKFAFYSKEPERYNELLSGKRINDAYAIAGLVEIHAQDMRILFGDGVNIRYYPPDIAVPEKHQLYLEFTDNSKIICTIQMYGGIWVYRDGENDNKYYLIAKEKPSPLFEKFNEKYFQKLFVETKQNVSVKAFLATEQRIPGLGNGVLQDILFNAAINPRTKIRELKDSDVTKLYQSIKKTLREMMIEGGRSTEKDIFGNPGGYEPIMSARSLAHPCPVCEGMVIKQAYMGVSVYFCISCQPYNG